MVNDIDFSQRKKIAEKLVVLRGEKSQQEVADAIGVSRSSIGMYESGKRMPRDQVKIRFAYYYKKSIEELFYT